MSLERRYRKLLRAYPVGYRAQREEEILGTYLELASQDRRWPAARDAADVLAGSLRERLRRNADTAQQRLARRRERAAPARPRTAPGSGRPGMAPRPAGGVASARGVAPAGGVA